MHHRAIDLYTGEFLFLAERILFGGYLVMYVDKVLDGLRLEIRLLCSHLEMRSLVICHCMKTSTDFLNK